MAALIYKEEFSMYSGHSKECPYCKKVFYVDMKIEYCPICGKYVQDHGWKNSYCRQEEERSC